MPAPRKYPNELRERSVRLVVEAMAEDPSLSLKGAVLRIGPRVGSYRHVAGLGQAAPRRCGLVAGDDDRRLGEDQRARA
jgi:hypothetical protein